MNYRLTITTCAVALAFAVAPLDLSISDGSLSLKADQAQAGNGNGGRGGGGKGGGGKGGGHGGGKGGGHGGGKGGGKGGAKGLGNGLGGFSGFALKGFGQGKKDKTRNKGQGFGKNNAKGLGKSMANGFSKTRDKLSASLDNVGKKVKGWGESLKVNGSAFGKLNGPMHAAAPALANASVNSPVGAFGQTYADAFNDLASGELTAVQELEAKQMMADVLAQHSNKAITDATVTAMNDSLVEKDVVNVDSYGALMEDEPDLAKELAAMANGDDFAAMDTELSGTLSPDALETLSSGE